MIPAVTPQQSAPLSGAAASDGGSIVRLLSEAIPENTRSYSEAVMANTVEECHREIDRLRRSHQVYLSYSSIFSNAYFELQRNNYRTN